MSKIGWKELGWDSQTLGVIMQVYFICDGCDKPIMDVGMANSVAFKDGTVLVEHKGCDVGWGREDYVGWDDLPNFFAGNLERSSQQPDKVSA